MRTFAVCCFASSLAAFAPAPAQTSASFKLTESTFNSGGHPEQGATMSSASYQISLDAVGDGLAAVGSASASFHVDGGYVSGFPPPGEVFGLRFASKTGLVWDGERSVGTYDLYRDALGSLPGAFGTCYQPALPTPSWTESTSPPPNNGWFYLVTAENRLHDEGTRGFTSGGTERSDGAACP